MNPLLLLLLLVALSLLPCLNVGAATPAHPNIILMMADDMGFSDISPYGGEVRTPNLQRLADEGLRFTQFYNNAKCTTTRACLLSGMNWVNEGGISTPFIVRWPGKVKPGTLTGQVGNIIDVLPTCLELADGKPLSEINGEKTRPLEGRSLAPVFRGETRTPPKELCWEWSGNCAIRHGKWKLVWDTLSRPVQWELYDIEADRTELNNLAGANPELVKELVKELSEAYEKWARGTGRKQPGVKGKKGADD